MGGDGTGAGQGGGQVFHVGGISGGAVNFGAGGSAHNVNNYGTAGPAPDPAQAELLLAVRELRRDLERLTRRPETEALDAELAETAAEIERSGATAPGRLDRLREALTTAGPVVEFLASGGAVAAAVATLLGG